MRELKGVPRTRIYRLLRKGEVRVDGRRANPSDRLQAGASIRLPPVRVAPAGNGAEPEIPPWLARQLRAGVIYQDRGLLAINKPAGLAVHGGSGLRFGLIEALRILRPEDPFLELVHRLDRETSGVLLVARRRSVLRRMHTLIRDGGLEKRYLTLLVGQLPRGPVPVEAALDRNARRDGERTVRVSAEGKASRSVFRALERYPGCCLAEVDIATGRTHQIRVHAAHLGLPVAGDTRYGDSEDNRRFRALGLKRLFLHAHYLAFDDPETGERRVLSAELSPDLRVVLDRLQAPPQDNGIVE
ncbi:MAG: RluA family pseudouridine synthase [Ectothiorhodospiraceae bacterium]|nr:RluA family pseudouridine synthase [Ectothiorhodospiraceae bacterium]